MNLSSSRKRSSLPTSSKEQLVIDLTAESLHGIINSDIDTTAVTSSNSPPSASSLASPGKKQRFHSPKSTSVEKRGSRTRSKPTSHLCERIERAMTQRLYLLSQSQTDSGLLSRSYAVLGSTGNVYDVKICQHPGCTCPDFERTNNPCKHILFVLLKVTFSETNTFLSL